MPDIGTHIAQEPSHEPVVVNAAQDLVFWMMRRCHAQARGASFGARQPPTLMPNSPGCTAAHTTLDRALLGSGDLYAGLRRRFGHRRRRECGRRPATS